MDMPSLQQLFGNLEDHEMELKRFSGNDNDTKKKSLAFKAIINFNNDEDDLETLKDLEEQGDLVLLYKKY